MEPSSLRFFLFKTTTMLWHATTMFNTTTTIFLNDNRDNRDNL